MSRDDPIKEGVKEKKEPEENFLAPKSISQADTQDFHNVCIFIGELPARIAESGRIRLCDNGRKYILLTVDLLPASLSCLESGVKEHLNGLLLHYNDDVEGVILAYNQDRIVSTTARVHPYFPLVRVIAEATLTVFKPQVGAKVVGIVNKSTEDYIGLLVLGFINVAVARKDIREDFLAPNLESNCWRSKKNPEHSIKVSDPVVFEIISIKQDGPYLALVGALRKNSTGNQAYVASHEDKKHKNKRKLSSKEGELKPKKDSEIPDPFVDGSVKHSGRDELLSTDLGNDGMHKGQDIRQDGLSDKPAKKKKTKKSNKSSEPDVGEKMRAKKKKRT